MYVADRFRGVWRGRERESKENNRLHITHAGALFYAGAIYYCGVPPAFIYSVCTHARRIKSIHPSPLCANKHI